MRFSAHTDSRSLIYPEIVRATALIPVLLALGLTGCNHPATTSASRDAAAQLRHETDSVRQDLEQIPLPSKSRYLAVHSLSIWENPYLTVQGSMVTLHVTVADANTSSLGVGGMLRPVGARRQDLNVRTADLPAALNAIPQSAWPRARNSAATWKPRSRRLATSA
jgi:hypothetical protein